MSSSSGVETHIRGAAFSEMKPSAAWEEGEGAWAERPGRTGLKFCL